VEKIIPFYTPIWRFVSPMNMDAHLQKCLKMESDNGVCVSNRGGYQSHAFLRDSFKTEFNEVYSFIMDCVNAVGEDTQSVYDLSNAWVNINRKNNYNTNHVHSQSSISGCMYIKTNLNSGNIVFDNPTPSKHYDINDNVDGFFGFHWRTPVAGEVLIFPSYLSHYVEPNNSEDVRVSIAFNCTRVHNALPQA